MHARKFACGRAVRARMSRTGELNVRPAESLEIGSKGCMSIAS